MENQKNIRIPPLPRAEWTDAARDVFAFWGEPDARENGSKTNIVMVLAQHPALAMAYNSFGKHILIDSTLPMRARELIVLRIAWLVKSEYEWHYHVGYALNIGMTLDEITAVKGGSSSKKWNDEDRSVLCAVDELWSASRVTDATWASLSRYLNKQQLMDLVFTTGQYVMLSWALNTFDVQIESGVDQVDYDLNAASGGKPLARYKPGEIDGWTSNRG